MFSLPRLVPSCAFLAKALLAAVLPLVLANCQSGSRQTTFAASAPTRLISYSKTGTASFYSNRLHGGPTASGIRYNRWAMTAAHRTLPLGCRVRVTHLASGRTVDVLITDRMGHRKRIIDLSYAAASKLGMVRQGLAKVRVEVVGMPEGRWRR